MASSGVESSGMQQVKSSNEDSGRPPRVRIIEEEDSLLETKLSDPHFGQPNSASRKRTSKMSEVLPIVKNKRVLHTLKRVVIHNGTIAIAG